jgi:hypothetical protein
VPGAIRGEEAELVIEGERGGDGVVTEVVAEILEPLAEEGGGGPPAGGAVTFCRLETEMGGPQRCRGKGGRLTDAEEVDEGEKNESIGSRLNPRCEWV